MAIDALHPYYITKSRKWNKNRHSFEGSDSIKREGETYLPPTSGQRVDGYGTSNSAPGQLEYESYRTRAYYPDIFSEAVEAAIGIMHREDPQIQLPLVLEPLRLSATSTGESLAMLLRRINAGQLITGRLGLAGDIVSNGAGSPIPVLSIYSESAVINWKDVAGGAPENSLKIVVLDETGFEMGINMEWEEVRQYKVLALTNDGKPSPEGIYSSALMNANDELEAAQFESPNISGKTLDRLPFTFINSKDLDPAPDNPPLDGLAELCLAIYRGEADYRQNLFMQGQDTLVLIGKLAITDGDDEITRTGAGARIDVPLGGDAKYIGVNSQGLPEQRQAIGSDYSRANQKSGQLIDATSRAKESGDALRIRVAAQTATLPHIASTGAAGLEKVLKDLAIWYGANPEEVVITPNLEFTATEGDAKNLLDLVSAKSLGAPISRESIHKWMVKQNFTSMDYQSEIALVEIEKPDDDIGIEPSAGGAGKKWGE